MIYLLLILQVVTILLVAGLYGILRMHLDTIKSIIDINEQQISVNQSLYRTGNSNTRAISSLAATTKIQGEHIKAIYTRIEEINPTLH